MKAELTYAWRQKLYAITDPLWHAIARKDAAEVRRLHLALAALTVEHTKWCLAREARERKTTDDK